MLEENAPVMKLKFFGGKTMRRPSSRRLMLMGILASLLLAAVPIYSAQASYVADAAITAEVKAKFLAEKGLDSLDLKVETSNGVVTLRGQVVNAAQSSLAERVAQTAKGVREVQNKISVMP
jgi:hypothetical protein